jgi:PAS domain S-box-containing protein
MATSELIGPSPTFRALLTEAEKVAPVGSAILIQDEKGSGKEVFARAIHGASPRGSRRFVALNCSANQSAVLESGQFHAAATDIDDRKVAKQRLQQENVPQREGVDEAPTFEEIVGALALLKNVLSRISSVVPTDSSVSITGETGAGKELTALHLENNSTGDAVTSGRGAVVDALASHAGISLEIAHLLSDLQLQAGLLQHLPVSAWTLKADGTPDFVNHVWLEFSGQTLEFVRSHPEAWMTAVHPDDRETASKAFWDGVRSGQGFAVETRSLRAKDETYRWHLQQAVPLRDAEGKVLRFVGTTTDIDNQKRAEEALRRAQGDLARINRVTTMGELAASLAHEVSQPISGAVTNVNVCLRKLASDQPDLDEVRVAVTRIGRDAQRAADIVGRIRSQFEKATPNREVLDVNEIIRETAALLRSEAVRYNISVRTELAADLPQIIGDRVQLQQVTMNLIVNSLEAMKDVEGIRELAIQSQRGENEQLLVTVSDTGMGFPQQLAEQIFDPFFTTKSHGTGMGLRISRSIIESHGGRLWAAGAPGRGATFHLNLPSAVPSYKSHLDA